MTIADDGSTNSGYVYDALHDQNVWRYGTERPCNLRGRYVTIFADYSAITKPYEIALCQIGIMGDPLSQVEEEVIESEPEVEHVPPTFAEKLQPSTVVLDEASTWVLPEVIIGSAALVEVVVIPSSSLKNSIEYDA